ncbi:response regulator transcription factor [Aerococcus urinae]
MEAKKQILLIDAEEEWVHYLGDELNSENYFATIAHDGPMGLELAHQHQWDLILLDLDLPLLNGLEVMRRLRQEMTVPILVMTQRSSVIDQVSALDQGADGYLIKPLPIEVFLAHIRSILRRMMIEANENHIRQTRLVFRDLLVEKENHLAYRAEEVLDLTKREYDLLVIFMENINKVLSREKLLKDVWGFQSVVETNVVDVYIRYLRNKIDPNRNQKYIQTIRGAGYVMRDEDNS